MLLREVLLESKEKEVLQEINQREVLVVETEVEIPWVLPKADQELKDLELFKGGKLQQKSDHEVHALDIADLLKENGQRFADVVELLRAKVFSREKKKVVSVGPQNVLVDYRLD